MLLGILIESGFVLGVVGTYLGSRTKDRTVRRARWTKLAGYFVIVHIVIGCALTGPGPSTVLAIAVSLGCLGELVAVSWRHRSTIRPRGLPLVVVPVLLSLAGALCFLAQRPETFLHGYVLIAVLDAYSQITGQLIGKTPLAPRISPAKTIEGTLGGVLFALGAALALGPLTGRGWAEALGLGAAVCVAGVLGDLGASWYKRRCGVKDYSSLLPGQGGFLDRFNSFLAASPVLLLFGGLS